MTKKPVVIKAVRITGSDAVQFTGSNLVEVLCVMQFQEIQQELDSDVLIIPTAEGDVRVLPGDWLIKGDEEGEFGLLKVFKS